MFTLSFAYALTFYMPSPLLQCTYKCNKPPQKKPRVLLLYTRPKLAKQCFVQILPNSLTPSTWDAWHFTPLMRNQK